MALSRFVLTANVTIPAAPGYARRRACHLQHRRPSANVLWPRPAVPSQHRGRGRRVRVADRHPGDRRRCRGR